MKRALACYAAAFLLLAGVAGADEDQEVVGPLKNLQRLKGLEKIEVLKIMKGFSRSLGVKCDFCHVKGDFAADENGHKSIAREMMAMVDTLNESYFREPDGAKASCFMCHRGEKNPRLAP